MKKRKGFALLVEALLVCIMIGLVGIGMIGIQASALKNADASETGFQAQFVAVTKANEINVTPYSELAKELRAEIKGTQFEREVLMGDEELLPDHNRKRKMTVNVYKGDETLPRYSLVLEPTVRGTPFSAGMIIMYAGNLADIPAGWALCDGANGTPDLRARFVMMYGQMITPLGFVYNVDYGSTGGTMYHNHQTQGHALNIEEMPSHTHNAHSSSIYAINGGSGLNTKGSNHRGIGSNNITVENSGGGLPHDHGKTVDEYNIPPYYALAYIIKK